MAPWPNRFTARARALKFRPDRPAFVVMGSALLVRVARCLTRDLWLRFPMLATLEYLVVLLNGWPGLATHQHHRLRAA